MRILVLADTHGAWETVGRILKDVGQVDGIFHCGDGVSDLQAQKLPAKCWVVKGNNDVAGLYADSPLDTFVELQGVKILCTHGHKHGVRMGLLALKYFAVQKGCNVVLFGHTHVPLSQMAGDVLFCNPGAGINGRYGILEICDGEAEFTCHRI